MSHQSDSLVQEISRLDQIWVQISLLGSSCYIVRVWANASFMMYMDSRCLPDVTLVHMVQNDEWPNVLLIYPIGMLLCIPLQHPQLIDHRLPPQHPLDTFYYTCEDQIKVLLSPASSLLLSSFHRPWNDLQQLLPSLFFPEFPRSLECHSSL